jgi:hypothetical protein
MFPCVKQSEAGGKEEMAISSDGRGCLAFESLVLLKLALPRPWSLSRRWQAVPSLDLPSWQWVRWRGRVGGGDVTVVIYRNAWDS